MWIKVGLILLTCLSLSVGKLTEYNTDDGYTWTQLDDKKDVSKIFKAGIVIGFFSATTGVNMHNEFRKRYSDSLILSKLLEDFRFPPLSVGDFSDAIDSFYSDYANKNINLFFAFQYVRMRLSGVPEDSLKSFVESMRKGAAKSK